MKPLPQIQCEHLLLDAAMELEHSRYNVSLLQHYLKHKVIDKYQTNHQRFGPFTLTESGCKRIRDLTLPQAMDRLERALETLSRTKARVKARLKPDVVQAKIQEAERYYMIQRTKRGLGK